MGIGVATELVNHINLDFVFHMTVQEYIVPHLALSLHAMSIPCLLLYHEIIVVVIVVVTPSQIHV